MKIIESLVCANHCFAGLGGCGYGRSTVSSECQGIHRKEITQKPRKLYRIDSQEVPKASSAFSLGMLVMNSHFS